MAGTTFAVFKFVSGKVIKPFYRLWSFYDVEYPVTTTRVYSTITPTVACLRIVLNPT